MNIIYETTKERGATILMPSSMVDSLNPSASVLAAALAVKGLNGKDGVNGKDPGKSPDGATNIESAA